MDTKQTNASQLNKIGQIKLETLVMFIGIILIIGVLLFHQQTLLLFPIVHGDEPWFADAIWNFVNNGQIFDTMHSGALDQFGYEWSRRYFLGITPWAMMFSVAGVGLYQARLMSLIVGGVLLFATFLVGRRSSGNMTGILAALLLAISPVFFHASHFARQDIFLATVLMFVYLLVLIALDNENPLAHFGAGLIMGLSIDVHQNGYFFIPALAIIYLSHYGKSIFRKRGPWLAVFGGLLGIAYYLIVFVLPSPETYFTLYSFDFNSENEIYITQGLRGIVEGIRTEIGRYRFFDNNLIFGLLGAGVAYLMFRWNRFDRRLLIMVGVTFFVFALFRGSKTIYYAILLFPFMILLIAETLVGVFSSATTHLQKVFIAAIIAMLLVVNGMRLVESLENQSDFSYEAISQQIQSVIPDGAKVMGLPTWWFSLPQADYSSSLTLNYYAFFNDYNFEQGISAIRPDYIIIDDVLRGALTHDTFTTSPNYGVPGDDFYAFLADQGTLILEFDTQYYGTIAIYAIDWEERS